MKVEQYRFESGLDAAQILARLRRYAKPARRGSWPPASGTFYYRIYADGTFWLVRTSDLGGSGRAPFCAKISPGTGAAAATITGSFTQPPETKKLLILCSFIGPVGVLLMGGPAFFLPAILFWVWGGAIIYAVFYGLAPLWGKKEQRAVLAFIEEHLLS